MGFSLDDCHSTNLVMKCFGFKFVPAKLKVIGLKSPIKP